MFFVKIVHIYCVDMQCFGSAYVRGACASRMWGTSFMVVKQLSDIRGRCKEKHSELRNYLCERNETAEFTANNSLFYECSSLYCVGEHPIYCLNTVLK